MLKQDWGMDGPGHLRSPVFIDKVGERDVMEEIYAAPETQWMRNPAGGPPSKAAGGQTAKPSGKRKAMPGGVYPSAADPRKKAASSYAWTPAAGSDPCQAGTITHQASNSQKGKKEKSSDGTTRGGRPVTWYGGGGMNPQDLVGLGVPKLRAIFLEVFGHHTASNNGAWLRRKLCEKPDATRGRGRSASIRRRDAGAAIWTTGAVKNITQAEAKVLVENGAALANASFIALPEQAASAIDAASVAGSPSDTPSVTPTRHQHKVLAVSKPVKLTYNSWGKPAKRPSTCPDRPATRRPLSEAFDATAAATAAAAATARWTAATAGKVGGPGERPEMVRRLLQRGDISHAGNFKGQQVEVFWPQDATWWLARIIKLNSKQCQVVYETGETEDLCTDELIREGIMSVGWVPAGSRPESAGQLSVAGMSQGRQEHGSPASVQRGPGQSPAASTPGLTPELRQLINADVDVRRAASLDNGADSSDMDSGDMDRFHVDLVLRKPPSPSLSLAPRNLRNIGALDVIHSGYRPAPHSPIDRDTQEWADNLLLTARKAPAPEKRERSGSQDSSRCSASPVGASAGAMRGPAPGSGMQRVIANAKITSGGRMHPAAKSAGAGHAVDGWRPAAPAALTLEYRFGACHMPPAGGFAIGRAPDAPPTATEGFTLHGTQSDLSTFDLNLLDASTLWNEPLNQFDF
ncbi:hypothetical protein COCSUDRAFT_67826 [Coccomyxa subellipsoidea C-169]|uniref:Tudor domain-containing protein n=1 Tax=Coccomyxa subellipsoidea (strain C-169) TaxID=574566 RepID=I0YLK4_COCSC|nr:hypothetical protein COCSUDRAFT_67826 [Coccomyxa subellipsoidea C-169]EIE19273.1 hypothetical protein COCSUDRAFT_67826 [Coccomyxa subellipsoidea C-169]|eukprot:XP_005643817.1 hypothetical protein COCSUDRAFT_67826 [Coccomyxa subellipsoidea C-169]